jgi:hypothetical protein
MCLLGIVYSKLVNACISGIILTLLVSMFYSVLQAYTVHNMLYAVCTLCTENPVIFAEILKLQVNATWPNSANWSKLPKFNYVLGGPVNTKT